MRDRPVILAGAVVMCILVTGPIWYARAAGSRAIRPELSQAREGTACVLDVGLMRSSHMQVLTEWRDLVVRQGVRSWTSPGGVTYTASLTGTCLRCHGRHANFCDRCHTFAGAAPACWDCHADTPAEGRSTP